CNNSSRVSRTINWTSDLTPPVITATGSIGNGGDLGCNPTSAQIDAALGSASAVDNCGAVSPNPAGGITGQITSNGCARSQTRTWIATDACNNSATASRTINWTSDVTPPEVTCPHDTVIGECNNILNFTGTAIDNC